MKRLLKKIAGFRGGYRGKNQSDIVGVSPFFNGRVRIKPPPAIHGELLM